MQENGEINPDKIALDKSGFSGSNHLYSTLSKSQKIGVVFLAFFAVFAVLIWTVQFKQSISGQFSKSPENAMTNSTAAAPEQDEETRLSGLDTDEDGLSDWDELNLHLTSPYLEDSDSDGFSDYEEIGSGNDPNCPVGSECGASELGNGSEQSAGLSAESGNEALNSLMEQLGSGQTETLPTESDVTTEALGELFASEMDAATLRQILIESGLDENALKQISDEQLMQSFLDVMQEE